MKLSNFTHSKDNNFNLIRIIAAFAVLITHSFALALGSGDVEPHILGMTMGSVAVDVFFITSGFLVTASLFNRQSTVEFIWARFLRIYPALLVMVLITVFGIGMFFTSMPVTSYLSKSATYLYFLKCSTLVAGVTYNLPGVFDGNPYKNAVNGSLWTMPYELRMYAILVLVWMLLRILKKARIRVFEFIIVFSTIVAAMLVFGFHFLASTENFFSKLFFMFFSGATFYVLRRRILLSHSFFCIAVISLIISATVNRDAFFVVYFLTIAYILFYLAYVPSGRIRSYNKLGDYSYGVYIYAFPVQQSVAALVPNISVFMMITISATVTFLLAISSWYLLEERALSLKSQYVTYTRKFLRLGEVVR